MKTILCSNCLEENKKSAQICEYCKKSVLLNDKYQILKILGENIGTTFLVKNIKDNQKYVIKELSIKKIKSWKNEELFKREQKIVSNLDYQYIRELLLNKLRSFLVRQLPLEFDSSLTEFPQA